MQNFVERYILLLKYLHISNNGRTFDISFDSYNMYSNGCLWQKRDK